MAMNEWRSVVCFVLSSASVTDAGGLQIAIEIHKYASPKDQIRVLNAI